MEAAGRREPFFLAESEEGLIIRLVFFDARAPGATCFDGVIEEKRDSSLRSE
jgi:hypothetical protein